MISKPSTTQSNPLRVGIGGPVGSGKTALTLALCQALRDEVEMAVVTNDIYTAEDAKFLVAHAALDLGSIDPEHVITPGLFVQRIVQVPRTATGPAGFKAA